MVRRVSAESCGNFQRAHIAIKHFGVFSVERFAIIAMNVELNITLRCNLRCNNCNRLCHLFPKRTDDVMLTQIDRFILEADGKHVNKVKLLGGESLLHPFFLAVYWKLVGALDAGIIGQLKIDTNQTIPRPDVPSHPRVRWMGKRQARKRHLPTLWAPCDMGYSTHGPCAMTRICGASLDNRGWLPCSAAIMIVRCFGLDHLYRQELPLKPWGLDELCHLCVFSMPAEWCREHCYPVLNTPPEARIPTKSWKAALEGYRP